MIKYFGFRLFRSIVSSLNNSIDIAMISNYRDIEDVRRFGFRDINNIPEVLPWIEKTWCNYRAKLFMIGSLTENCINNPKKTNQQFIKAVEIAVANGAKVILFAAATKRLLLINSLKVKYPQIVFTLGDNFTSLLLKEGVQNVISKTKVKSPKILVIAPHGFLGKEIFNYLLENNYEVVGLINSSKIKNFQERIKINIFNSFENIGKVDIVVACGNAPHYYLTPQRIEAIRKENKKLIVVDPCEPPNMTFISDKVIRVDAGNGYSPDLKYIFSPISYKILRLNKNISWGCFCEAFIIRRHIEDIKHIDWFKINNLNQSILKQKGGFNLPAPTCFNKKITNWDIEL